MKYKTSEIDGALLDAAVAKAEGWSKADDDPTAWWSPNRKVAASVDKSGILGGYGYHPAHNWAQGGPIIEREQITVMHFPAGFTAGEEWEAYIGHVDPSRLDLDPANGEGPTPLIAAMRAFVAHKLGDEVEL